MKASQHHELMRLTSLGELTPSEYSELTGENVIKKMEPKKRPEAIIMLYSLINLIFCSILLIGLPYGIMAIKDTAINLFDPDKLENVSMRVKLIALAYGSILSIFLFALNAGEFDPWIKKNIDPYIIKLKTWLNRRNE